jgi:EmrB/QacA subfamily drug resistance transporter
LLIAGTTLFGLSSLFAGLATGQLMLIVARLAQGAGAAMMTPAALSIITTSFPDSEERVKAIGAWSATIPMASAFGVFAGGLLSQGPGWRWVFFVNIPVCALVIFGATRLIDHDARSVSKGSFDIPGAVLSTAGMLGLVYTLVRAPEVGWANGRTVAGLAGAAMVLMAFVVNEIRRREPLVPFSIFKIPGLAAADITQVIANAGFYGLFFFVTLYMQSVLGFSPIIAGAAYIPVTMAVGMSAGISTKMLPRLGARPIIVAGTIIGAVGLVYLSRIPVRGTYAVDILPGLVVMAFGLGGVLVGVQNAANADVPQDKAGLAAALISTSSTLGGALGLAIFSAIATGHTNHLLSHHVARAAALTGGCRYALLAAAVFLIAASLIATRTSNSRGVEQPVFEEPVFEEPTKTLAEVAA